jgi:membrane fusion protein (multidrug efflux system)
LGPESGVLATVVSLDPILATFGISDKVISQYQIEMKNRELSVKDWQVRLRLAPDVCYPVPGPISYVAPMVDPQTDTIKFKAKFANADKILRPGQIVTAVVERIRPDRRVVVPKEAVLTDTEGRFVYMVKETPADPEEPESKPGLAAEPRRVALEEGDPLDKEYIIRDGLAEGDQVSLKGLMSGGATLRAGAPVRVVTPPEESREAPAAQPAAADGGQDKTPAKAAADGGQE